MVRLREDYEYNVLKDEIQFQFLNGTIKRIAGGSVPCVAKIFQFLNGTIKSYLCEPRSDKLRQISIPKWYD